MKQPNLVRSN